MAELASFREGVPGSQLEALGLQSMPLCLKFYLCLTFKSGRSFIPLNLSFPIYILGILLQSLLFCASSNMTQGKCPLQILCFTAHHIRICDVPVSLKWATESTEGGLEVRLHDTGSQNPWHSL